MKKIIFLLVIAAAVLNSCSKHLDPVITPDRLKAILLGKDTLLMYTGDVRQVNITLTPSDYNENSLVWNSSDSTVIAVTNSGKVTAKKPGTSKINVSNQTNTVSVSCLVSVIPKPDSLKIGLIAYYPFNNSGIDSSGNGNNGTVHGALPAPNRFGTANTAYSFDGVSSYIIVPDNPALRLNSTDFTINTWVKLGAYNSSYGSSILSKRITGNDNGWAWGVHGSADANIGKITYGPGGTSNNVFSNAIFPLNNWHMITGVYNVSSAQFSLYIDGVLDGTTTGILSANASVTAMLYIGTDNPSIGSAYYFQGSLDDIRIYSRKLSLNDIHKLYTRTY